MGENKAYAAEAVKYEGVGILISIDFIYGIHEFKLKSQKKY